MTRRSAVAPTDPSTLIPSPHPVLGGLSPVLAREVARIGLTGYTESKALSEETIAFTVTITLDGKGALHAQNRGHGGSNLYTPMGNAPVTARDEVERIATLWGAATSHTFEALDALVSRLAMVQGIAKDVKALQKKFATFGERIRCVLVEKDPFTIGEIEGYAYVAVTAFDAPIGADEATLDSLARAAAATLGAVRYRLLDRV